MPAITFKPKQVVKRLLSVLPDRAREVVTARYGLGDNATHMTLESIGENYKITRERVRQIENHALISIRKSDPYSKERQTFEELEQYLNEMGGMVMEKEFLNHVAKDQSTQNHIHFLLVVGERFKKRREDDNFAHRWYVEEELADTIEKSLKGLYESLSDEDLIPESEFIHNFLGHLQEVNKQYRDEEIAKRWLSLSKKMSRNPLGEWGKAVSPNVRAKGMRDFAYLTIRRHGSPMHFKEVAKAIQDLFDRKAHVATCHNELIKDARFVLVGRGLYALKEWGYQGGVVREVIRDILRRNGALTKEEILDKVMKERYVKPNTVMVNLQNRKYFLKGKDRRYTLSSMR